MLNFIYDDKHSCLYVVSVFICLLICNISFVLPSSNLICNWYLISYARIIINSYMQKKIPCTSEVFRFNLHNPPFFKIENYLLLNLYFFFHYYLQIIILIMALTSFAPLLMYFLHLIIRSFQPNNRFKPFYLVLEILFVSLLV